MKLGSFTSYSCNDGKEMYRKASCFAYLILLRFCRSRCYTYGGVSMKAKPRGHIAITLYKKAEAHATTTTKHSFHNCYTAALCNNRSDNRKDLTLHVFPKDPCRRLVSPLERLRFTFTLNGKPDFIPCDQGYFNSKKVVSRRSFK